MKRFYIEDYPDAFCRMHCDTEDKAKIFLAHLDSLGKKWRSKALYTEMTQWDMFKDNTVYYFNKGVFDSITHDLNKPILEFDNFDWSYKKLQRNDLLEMLEGI